MNLRKILRMRNSSKKLAEAVLTIGLIYVLLLTFLFVFQRKLQYIPLGKIQNIATYHLDKFEEKILVADDSTKILFWYRVPEKGEKIILYFHGNAGNLGDRAFKFDVFSHSGFGVLAIAYRGYSGSEGKPSEDVLIKDAQMALQFLLTQGYQKKDIILFGESLGSGIATQLAAKHEVAAVVLESPFSSIISVAQKRYWFAPISLLLKDKFESIKFAPKILSPVLIIHGTSDGVVPYSEGQKLFAAVNSRKKFLTVEGAGHLKFGEYFLVLEMKKFLAEGL